MLKNATPGSIRGAVLVVSLAGAGMGSGARAADTVSLPTKAASSVAVAPAAAAAAVKPHPRPSRYAPDRFAGRAGRFYELIWGIDSISVKLVESGELVRFSYRVLDPTKASVLNDKQYAATLNDPQAGVSLVVPTMEKIGALRQGTAPEAGRSYWMAFSNKGRRVVRGHRVDVVIGAFKASNLVVD